MIDPLFQYRQLNEAGVQKGIDIAQAFTDCLDKLRLLCPEGREFALVKTHLETASFWAKKSMANDRTNQT